MPIFCQENVHSQKNTILSKNVRSLKNTALMSFFQNFHEKLSAVKPIFCQKNVNSVNTTLCYGPNKTILCPFFLFFTKSICSHIIFFEFSMTNPLLPCLYLVEKNKVNSVKTTLYYGRKKFYKMPFSSDFSRKNYCPNAHVV